MDVELRAEEASAGVPAAPAAPAPAAGLVGWWRRRNLTLPAVAKQEM